MAPLIVLGSGAPQVAGGPFSVPEDPQGLGRPCDVWDCGQSMCPGPLSLLWKWWSHHGDTGQARPMPDAAHGGLSRLLEAALQTVKGCARAKVDSAALVTRGGLILRVELFPALGQRWPLGPLKVLTQQSQAGPVPSCSSSCWRAADPGPGAGRRGTPVAMVPSRSSLKPPPVAALR